MIEVDNILPTYNDYQGKKRYGDFPSVDPFATIQAALDQAAALNTQLQNDAEKNEADEVYKLGCSFYELVGKAAPEGKTLDQCAEDARQLFSGVLPEVQSLQHIANWMLHSDSTKRPSLDQVCTFLQKHLSNPLAPLHTLDDCHGISKVHKKLFCCDSHKKIELFLKKHPTLLEHSNCYISRKKAKLLLGKNRYEKSYWLLDNEEPYFLLLHKKTQYAIEGSCKIGRIARIIKKVQGEWKNMECFVLTSKRGKICQEIYKEAYPKEMAIYKKAEGQNIFMHHIGSFSFKDRPHKRLGIYACALATLNDASKDKIYTIQKRKNLVIQVKRLHELGLAHRDIKPKNVLVSAADDVRLGDVDSICEGAIWQKVSAIGMFTKGYLRNERSDNDRFKDDTVATIRTVNIGLSKEHQASEELDLDELVQHLDALHLDETPVVCSIQ